MTTQQDLFDANTSASGRSELDRLAPRRETMMETLMSMCRAARERAILAEADRSMPVQLPGGIATPMLTEQMVRAAVQAAAIMNRDINLSLALWAEQKANRLKQTPFDARVSREALAADEIAQVVYEARRGPDAVTFDSVRPEAAAAILAASAALLEAVESALKHKDAAPRADSSGDAE